MLDFIFKNRNRPDAFVSDKDIQDAYKRREKDIDSLRQYDRGEKDIHAPNLRDIVQNLRKTL